MQNTKKISFGVKLVCYIVLVSMIALSISTLMISKRMTAMMEDNMQLTSEQTMSEAVSGFQRYMKTLNLPIDLMCRRDDFKKIDMKYNVRARIDGIEDSLLSALKVIPNSEKAFYATASGKYIEAKLVVEEDGEKVGKYTEKSGIDNTGENWYQDALGLKARYTVFGNFTTPYINADGIEVFTVSQDLKSSDVHVGIVAMDINLQVLKDYIDGIALMTTGFTILADENGNLIVNNSRNTILKNPASEIPVWSALVSKSEENAQAALSGDVSAEVNPSASLSCEINGEKYIVTLIKDTITGWYMVGLIGEEAELAGSMRTISATAGIGFAIALILSLIVSLIISFSIVKELRKLQFATKRMANGDLSTKLEVKRHDEFGVLEHNFNGMMDSISGLIRNVGTNSDEIYGIARSVMEVSKDTREVAQQVTEAIGSVAQGATEQAQSTADANKEVEKLANSMSISKERTEKIGEKSKETEQLGKRGIVILDDLIKKSERAKANADDSIATMSKMLKSIDKINYISDAIADITAQTNLLSLNASIEAARAGDSGKGFAVVADEIRKLAEQSKESTEEIKKIVAEIAGNSTQVEDSLEESGVIQDDQRKSIIETQELFEEIEVSVKELMQAVAEIESLNREMSAARDNVVDRMENIASVSETSAAATEEVNASAEQVNSTMEQMAEHARMLDAIVAKLGASVKQFKL